jgi:signal transduction histidine kinase
MQAQQRQVTVVINPNMRVEGDINLVKIVLENLLSNAVKFTGKCEQAVIQVGMLEQSGERIFFVRDNGAGFNMEYASKLFAPFQRLHGVEEFPGSGIGLSIVQRIITRHGGRIWPESKLGQGTTFYFTLGQNH